MLSRLLLLLRTVSHDDIHASATPLLCRLAQTLWMAKAQPAIHGQSQQTRVCLRSWMTLS